MAQEEDIILIHEGKPVGYLVGFADEEDWIDYLMLHNPEFQERLRRSLNVAALEARFIVLEVNDPDGFLAAKQLDRHRLVLDKR
ncbi:MAG: hypothetical protein LDL41_20220 [Coleofasciculus sp. S288]|nr:hypothetical protein [Coleofasciculus sp. S288]